MSPEVKHKTCQNLIFILVKKVEVRARVNGEVTGRVNGEVTGRVNGKVRIRARLGRG